MTELSNKRAFEGDEGALIPIKRAKRTDGELVISQNATKKKVRELYRYCGRAAE